jgi:hypothetical protein
MPLHKVPQPILASHFGLLVEWVIQVLSLSNTEGKFSHICGCQSEHSFLHICDARSYCDFRFFRDGLIVSS